MNRLQVTIYRRNQARFLKLNATERASVLVVFSEISHQKALALSVAAQCALLFKLLAKPTLTDAVEEKVKSLLASRESGK